MIAFSTCKKSLSVFGLLIVISAAVFATQMHHHKMQEVTEGSLIPIIKLEAKLDAVDGVNLILQTQNFELSYPQNNLKAKYVNEKQLLQGHAHLFVNGKKIQRVYGTYVHLPKLLLKEGENLVQVSLNSHSHENLIVKGKMINSAIKVNVSADDMINITTDDN